MGGFSLLHWIIILFIIVILFGAGKLPKIGEGLGRGIRAFKDELGGDDKTKKTEGDDTEALKKPAKKVVEGKVEKGRKKTSKS